MMVIQNLIVLLVKEVCKKYLDKNKIKNSLDGIEFEDNTLKTKK